VSDVVLALRGISKTFGGQRALDSIDLEILGGEVHALVGENGSGKSTLIKVLSGYHHPDPGGVVEVGGRMLPLGNPHESRRRGLRFVHQDLGLIDQFTALESFGHTSGFPGGVTGIDWRTLRATAEGLLDRVGIRIDLDRRVGDLTAVERTAVAIARCLDDSQLGAPMLLVLDEPTAALPGDDVERLFGIVREVAASGVAVLYVSHRLDEVMVLSDRVTAIRDGRFVATVPTERLDKPAIVRMIVGSELEDDTAYVRPVDGTGHRLEARGVSAPTLHGVSFTAEPGEILGFAGLDGSGRDAIARVLVGDAGGADRVLIDGVPFDTAGGPAAAARAGVALVLANRDRGAAVGGMTIAENVTHVSVARSRRLLLDRRGEPSRVAAWIERLSIRPPDPTRDYATLSGGNRQKVVFAKWLDIDPTVLILDDPTSGVDIGARRSMYSQIREVATRGVPVIVASSDLEDLVRLCTRVVVLVEGRVGAELTGTDITEARMTIEMSASNHRRKAG